MVAWLRQRSPGLQQLTMHVSAGCAEAATDADMLRGPDQVQEPAACATL